MLWQFRTPGIADTAARMRCSMPAGAESTSASTVRRPNCQHTQITRTETPSAATASAARSQPSGGAHSPSLTQTRPAITTAELHTSCSASASSAWLLYFSAAIYKPIFMERRYQDRSGCWTDGLLSPAYLLTPCPSKRPPHASSPGAIKDGTLKLRLQ